MKHVASLVLSHENGVFEEKVISIFGECLSNKKMYHFGLQDIRPKLS
jgi:hypothetical protein